MKKLTRAASLTTAFSMKDTANKDLSRLPSLCFDSLMSSPKGKRIAKGKKTLTGRNRLAKTGAVQVLEFTSQVRRKKYKLTVFKESDVLGIKKKFANRLISTPGADFDCDSDDDLIEGTIKQKLKELRAGLLKTKKAACLVN